jgi:release factor glutamine methyltransferase
MRKYLKYISSLVLVPFIRWYLKQERSYSYNGINVTVKPGVFHPGFFYSTKFLLSYLMEQQLATKKVIEVGCGTGLISIWAAKQNAKVTAIDINNIAIENTILNATKNSVGISTIQSDLFKSLQHQIFDWIVINPPYYAKDPVNESEFAWYCGKNFEYFEALFTQLPHYADDNSQIVMVLTKGCDLDSIFSIANTHGFRFDLIREKEVLFDEKDFLFKLTRINSSLANRV